MKIACVLVLLSLAGCRSGTTATEPTPTSQTNANIEKPNSKIEKPTDFGSAKPLEKRTDLPFYATQPVAAIDGELISAESFNRIARMELIVVSNKREYKDLPNEERLAKFTPPEEIVDRMIAEALVERASVEEAKNVPQYRVDKSVEMNTVYGGWAYTPQLPERAALLKKTELDHMDMTEDEYIAWTRKRLGMVEFIRKTVKWDEADLKRRLRAPPESYETLVIQHIQLPAKTSKKRAEKIANQIRNKLENGDDFLKLAKEYEPKNKYAGHTYYWYTGGGDPITVSDTGEGEIGISMSKDIWYVYRVVKWVPAQKLNDKEALEKIARDDIHQRFFFWVSHVADDLRKTKKVEKNERAIVVNKGFIVPDPVWATQPQPVSESQKN